MGLERLNTSASIELRGLSYNSTPYFLKDGGINVTAIDDVELRYLTALLDDIFEKDNYVSTIASEANPQGRVANKVSQTSEYHIIHAKNLGAIDKLFVKKLEKLKDKQLPLLYKDETQEYLEGIDINSFRQKICLKGNIYVPMHFVGGDIPIISNSCIKGFYINYEEFIKQKHFREYEYFLPPRNDWVSDCNTNETWRSFDDRRLRWFLSCNSV